MENEEMWRERVKDLLSQMTLEEKAGLLSYRSHAIPRLGIPEYNWWNEALHGVARGGTATSFPQAIGMAASFDEELVHQIGDVIATEGRAKYNESVKKGDRDQYKGLTFWSPNINIFRDPRWGRGHETFGEDPYLTSRMGVAYVKGVQGESEHLKAAACTKHLVAHSGPEEGRHSFNSVVSQKDLWETYLPAFEACVKEAKVEGVMGAYNRINGEACCGSSALIKGILREKWGFDGYFVSDCGAIADIHMFHELTGSAVESAALALDAGCDLNCGNVYLSVFQAVEQGLVSESAVDQAAEHLLMTWMRLGLLDETEYDDIPYEVVECREHMALAKEAAVRSMVLLKNDGILPLKREEIKTIGVIGPNADSRTALWGNYYGTSSRNITVLEGIQNAVGEDVRVLYSMGSHLYRPSMESGVKDGDRIAEAISVAERSDVVVLCLGLDATIEGEEGDACNEYAAGDKKSLSLPQSQVALLEAVSRLHKPTVLVMMAGSAMDLRYADQNVNAILQAWYPGAQGGAAVADVLFGDAEPSGKLPVTFYRSAEDLPEFEDYRMAGRTYRYFQGEVLYPFGYGLNYGDTYCAKASCTLEEDGTIVVEAQVENAGARSARDVLQVYVKNVDSPLAEPNYKLCGIKPFGLDAGQGERLTLCIPETALEVVTEEGDKVIDGKNYIFYVGCGQPDQRSAKLLGRKPVEIEVVRMP